MSRRVAEPFQVSRMQAVGAAALVGYLLLNHSATRLVTHHDQEMGHAAVERHERDIAHINTGLDKLGDTLKKLEADRIIREEKDKAEQTKRDAEAEEKRRAFWSQQRAESDTRQIQMIEKAIQAAVGNTQAMQKMMGRPAE